MPLKVACRARPDVFDREAYEELLVGPTQRPVDLTTCPATIVMQPIFVRPDATA